MILHTLLGNHPNTKALKSGQVSSPLVQFDYFEVKVANTQFKALVRDLKYDLGVREVYRLLKESRYAAKEIPQGAASVEDPLRFGITALRASLEQIVAYALRQRLIPSAFSADELFAPAARILGDGGDATK